MPEKWLDVVKENLESGDEKPYSWTGRLNKKNGYIVLLKKQMLFIEEHGFLNKTATLILKDEYKNIAKVELQREQVKLFDANGTTHTLETESFSSVYAKLEELRKQAA
ncbi:MAG: hypothetical protein V1915_00640 [Candidatus Bathyarchaeota archaeon]